MASGVILPKPGFVRSRPKVPSNSPLDTPEAVAAAPSHTPGALPSFFDQLPELQQIKGVFRNLSERQRGKTGRGFAAKSTEQL